jgi:prophage DNA circulation protein
VIEAAAAVAITPAMPVAIVAWVPEALATARMVAGTVCTAFSAITAPFCTICTAISTVDAAISTVDAAISALRTTVTAIGTWPVAVNVLRRS